ncbi:MAG: hypothetical protein ACRC9K_13450 [Afipia sp.]
MPVAKAGGDDPPPSAAASFLKNQKHTQQADPTQNTVSKIICLAFKIIILVIFCAAKQYETGNQEQAANGPCL